MRFGWLAAASLTALMVAAHPATASRPLTADDVTDKINPTGRVLPMTVSFVDNGRKLGDVMITVEADDTVRVARLSLMEALKGDLKDETVARLKALPDMVSVEDINKAGLALKFDRQKLELVMGLDARQRKDGDISFAGQRALTSGVLAKPAFFSGFLNFYGEADYLWQADQTAIRFDVEAAIRLGRVVFESEFSLQNDVNPLTCPFGAFCFFDHTGGIKRLGSRIVYDFPEDKVRLTLGDTRTEAATFQRNPSLLGATIEHSPSKLDPTTPIRATGSQSFLLERAARVEVLINGAVAQSLNLAPGSYNLRDLPLRAGANDITLLITDTAGATKTLHFTNYSSYTLLSAGKWEGAMSGGVPSYFNDSQIDYLTDRYFATTFLRYGLTSNFTFETQAQADNDVAMGGGGFAWGTPVGVFGTQLAVSETGHGVGAGGAARLTWDIVSPNGTQGLHVAAEVHTSGFRSPGQITPAQTGLVGVIFPTFQYKQSYAASYTQQLGHDWQATVTGRYDVADQAYYDFVPLAVHGDRYHADFSLSHPIFENATISGIVGWSNEYYNRSFTSLTSTNVNDTQGSLFAGLRFYWRPAERTTITASTDTVNNRSIVQGIYQTSPGIDSWTTSVTATDDRSQGVSDLNGSVSYRGQRAEVTVGHDTAVNAFTGNGSTVSFGEQRSQVRVGTALVFAGEHVAVSSPIRGDSAFAILYPHESIGDREITAGTRDYVKARSDWLGPAVATGLSAYQPQTLPVDVDNLPAGYSLGQSGFDLVPPYRGGYALQVGSGYSVSALGELVDGRGKPVGLAGGIASNGERQVTIFTNQGGRFAADGLSEGSWRLSVDTEDGPATYVIAVPKGTKGLLRLGKLRPSEGR